MVIRVKPKMQAERIKTLTDGVLAIVLTILVLSFEVPEHRFGHDALLDFFRDLARPFVAYVVSFGIVAAYWMQHAAIFHYVAFGNRTFFWLNILFLLPLTLLPFLTDLRATYYDEYVTTLLYAGANTACGVIMLALWSYGKRHGLMRKIVPAVDQSMRRRILLGVALNILGAAVAPIDPFLSSAVFLLLPCIYLSHRTVDSHWGSDGDDTAADRPEVGRGSG
jgi:uncharacterized membrane protein